MLVASTVDQKLLKVAFAFQTVHENPVWASDDESDEDENWETTEAEVETWTETSEAVLYVMAPAKYSGGELIDFVALYIQQKLVDANDSEILPETLQIKSVDFFEESKEIRTVLLQEMKASDVRSTESSP